MIVIHLRCGTSLGVPNSVAVAPGTFPTQPGSQPAPALNVLTADGRMLASFRMAEVAGFTLESQDEPFTVTV